MMRYLIMLFVFIVSLFAKGQNKVGFETMVNTLVKGKVDTITSGEVAALLIKPNTILLDAREPEEFAVSHIAGARNVGYDKFDFNALPVLKKTDTVLVYCSVGKRSEDVAFKLKKAGYINVYNLYGGIFDWTNRGYPVVNDRNEPVKCVHPYSDLWGYWVNNLEKCYEPR